jgi:HlyD family secretion protein
MKGKVTKSIIICLSVTAIISCGRDKFKYDASGTFEATEIMVSAEVSGKIEELNLTEGDKLTKGQELGYIDTTQLYLQKLLLQTSANAVSSRRPDISTQIASTKEQIAKAELEYNRLTNLLKDGAATQKQLDDAGSQVNILKKSLAAQLNSLTTSNVSLDKQSNVYEIQVAQIDDQLRKSHIINPIDGTVLSKYAEAKEMTSTGRPLYKIADMRNMFLRAYIISNQLDKIKIGQKATVFASRDNGKQNEYTGTVSWISGKAEFTPKTIQTQDERQNLVYAVKIAVENTDGLIKTGMYGDINFDKE